MATVNIAITATKTQLSKFADELGYQEFIGQAGADGTITVIPNPQDRKAFLQEYFKTITVEELAKVRIRVIDKEIRDQREADKQAYRDQVSAAVNVTFSA